MRPVFALPLDIRGIEAEWETCLRRDYYRDIQYSYLLRLKRLVRPILALPLDIRGMVSEWETSLSRDYYRVIQYSYLLRL